MQSLNVNEFAKRNEALNYGIKDVEASKRFRKQLKYITDGGR